MSRLDKIVSDTLRYRVNVKRGNIANQHLYFRSLKVDICIKHNVIHVENLRSAVNCDSDRMTQDIIRPSTCRPKCLTK